MNNPNIQELIRSSRPRRGFLRGIRPLALGAGLLLGAWVARPDVLGGVSGWIIVQIILLGFLAVVMGYVVRRRRLGRLLREGFEAVQLEDWDRAEPLLLRLLRRPITPAPVRSEALLSLTSVLEGHQDYAGAQAVYEAVLEDAGTDPLQAHNARVGLAVALFRNGQVTDAVELTDRLVREELPAVLQARIELLALFRELTMGQVDEGLARADQRRELFRLHLSTGAGYGYGLLAAAFDRAGQPDAARRHWHDATLLVAPHRLRHRFGELDEIAGRYPAAECPL
jgi:hypothetical protein